MYSEVLRTLYRQILLDLPDFFPLFIYAIHIQYVKFCFVHDASEKRTQECLRVHGGNGEGTIVNTREEHHFKG